MQQRLDWTDWTQVVADHIITPFLQASRPCTYITQCACDQNAAPEILNKLNQSDPSKHCRRQEEKCVNSQLAALAVGLERGYTHEARS